MNITANGTIHRLYKPREPIKANLIGSSQRYVVIAFSRMRDYLTVETNNVEFQITSREYNFDFHHRLGGTCRTTANAYPAEALS
jgi:hypothetical protein